MVSRHLETNHLRYTMPRNETIRLQGVSAIRYAECAELVLCVDFFDGKQLITKQITLDEASGFDSSNVWVDIPKPKPKRARGRRNLETINPTARDIVGTMSDLDAARLLGCSRSAVLRCRERLGIPRHHAPTKKEAVMVEAFLGESDD